MEAIQRNDDEAIDPGAEVDTVRTAGLLVAARRRAVTDAAAPLRLEAERVAAEIEHLREAARRKVWEAIVQTREIHTRLCDANARLEHLQLDIRDRTGEVRLPSVPMPFVDFLLTEIRRFVITVAAPDAEPDVSCSGR